MKILECSSKGDKRFSALYAKVNVFGFEDTIEGHYQNSKRNKEGYIVKKGMHVDTMVIVKRNHTIKLEAKYLTAYYKLLWCCYLDNNPDLVEYASKFDDYNDMFKGKAINCQADVIRQYIKQGRRTILSEPDVVKLREVLSI